MRNNNQTNRLIKWAVIIFDFLLMNALLYAFTHRYSQMQFWKSEKIDIFILICNLALVMSEYRFYTFIHRRLATAGDIVRRVIGLTILHSILAYLMLRIHDYSLPVGKALLLLDSVYFFVLIITRFLERSALNLYRKSGGNYRTVVFVGSDPELLNIYERLVRYPTKGFKILGYYSDDINKVELQGIEKLGSIHDILENIDNPQKIILGDDMYVCLSRRDATTVKKLSRLCDDCVIRFYYVPVSLETIGLNLKREFLEDVEVFATYDNPLVNPVNCAIKRVFDIIMSVIALALLLPFLPLIALGIKIQSPKGSVFFKQPRHGLDGKVFYCYKFRSMHPNKDESGSKQATKDDPRKFPFGNFMRKASIDELPQFWNVLKGEMSIVGPRPHPVVINEKYKELVDKYMARHFVKPGVTGWAQVTGFRGETEELWQMEGRVKRDIWYIENWSFWLDVRIIWMTIKQVIMHDEQAY